jgi:hypothetical protein
VPRPWLGLGTYLDQQLPGVGAAEEGLEGLGRRVQALHYFDAVPEMAALHPLAQLGGGLGEPGWRAGHDGMLGAAGGPWAA